MFYQIYAPTRLKDSLKKEIQDKFTADLSGLLKIIYEEIKWAGKLNNFIFIVTDYTREILTEIHNIEVLKQISATLHIKGMIDYNALLKILIK